MDKKQVQEAIKRIDNALAQLTTNRQGHIVLADNLRLVQQCCMEYFNGLEAKKDGRTDEPIDDTGPGNKDS